jgi:hypothetical protein
MSGAPALVARPRRLKTRSAATHEAALARMQTAARSNSALTSIADPGAHFAIANTSTIVI